MVYCWDDSDHDHDHDAHLGVSLEYGGELGRYVDGEVVTMTMTMTMMLTLV